MRRILRIAKLIHETDGRASRVSAEVQGVPIWFESSDIPLRAAPEAFLSPLVIPALWQKTDLVVDGALDSEWLSNVQRAMAIFGKWWGYPAIMIEGTGEPASTAEAGNETALCFTGGVDSFYSLLRGKERPRYLVFAHGFDIPLRDESRMRAFRSSFDDIARETRTQAAVIRTNLREHPFFARTTWNWSHGGALAALAHCIDGIGRFLISSSHPYGFEIAWGSSWETDPLWSSSRVTVRQEGDTHWRSEKLRAVADEPLLQKHLRVCWENRTTQLNCCRCEKCLRTMIILTQCERLERFATFPEKDRIAEGVERIPFVRGVLITVYEGLLRQGLPPDLAQAVEGLLERSYRQRTNARSPSLPARFWRRIPQPWRQMAKALVPLSARVRVKRLLRL